MGVEQYKGNNNVDKQCIIHLCAHDVRYHDNDTGRSDKTDTNKNETFAQCCFKAGTTLK